MRLIQDPAAGASSCNGLTTIKDALMFMVKCEKDPKLFMSNQWSSTIESLQGEVMSLRTFFRYTEIGYEGYHEFQSLVTNALFFVSRALDGIHLYREPNWNSAYVLVDSMEDLRLAIEKIYHYATAKAPTYIVHFSMDLLSESIEYLLRLARMNCSGLRMADEAAFWRQISFLEFICSHVSDHHIISELSTPEHILVDTQAAVDTVTNILSEYDPLYHSWLYSDKGLIDPASNVGISSDLKFRKLGKNVEFISIAIYVVIEKCRRSSWINEVVVQSWEHIIDIMLHLLHQDTILIVPWKDQMGVLHDELSFLKCFLLDPLKPHIESENTNKGLGELKCKICKQVSALIYSFHDTNLRKKAISEIRETIDPLKSLFKESRRVPYLMLFDQIKNYASVSFDRSLEKLFIFMQSESVSIAFSQTKKVLEELTDFKNSLNKISGAQMAKDDLQMKIGDLSIVLEYVIKPPEVKSAPVWLRILWFLEIVDSIKLVKETIKDAKHMSDYESVGLEEEKGGLIQFGSMTRTDEAEASGRGGDEYRLRCAQETIPNLQPNCLNIWKSGRQELVDYLEAIEEVQRLKESFRSMPLEQSRKLDELDRQAQNILQIAREKLVEVLICILGQYKHWLEEEFMPFRSREIIFSFEESRISTEDDSLGRSSWRGSSSIEPEEPLMDFVYPVVLRNLKSIGEVMVSLSYGHEFSQSFISFLEI